MRSCGVTCKERPDVALALVTACPGQDVSALTGPAELIGVHVPDVGRFEETELSAFWSGPDQWSVEATFQTLEYPANQMKHKLANAASVSKQTDA